jgi:AcrR family transcriptional regulator
MRSNNKKEQILEAALQVVEENGANHLTIDAVAACANFSKGGVLYHFPSKKALLSGMLDHLIQANEKRMNALDNSDNLLSAFLHKENQMSAAERRASLALLAAAAEDPELLTPAKDYMKRVIDEISQSSQKPMEALTLLLAREGIRFLDILEINPMSAKQTQEVVDQLSQRAREV